MSTGTCQLSVDELNDVLTRLEIVEDPSTNCNLNEIVQLIEAPFVCVDNERCECIICNIINLQNRTRLVKCHMGSMAQCRGARGEELREVGAISAVLNNLWRLMVPQLNQWVPRHHKNSTNVENASYPPLLPSSAKDLLLTHSNFTLQCAKHHKSFGEHIFSDSVAFNTMHSSALDLAVVCLGALRDLSCGSALSRSAILEWASPFTVNIHYRCNSDKCLVVQNGIHLLCAYILRYHELNWEDILLLGECSSSSAAPILTSYTDRGKKELRLLTNTLGAIRNTSHSTPDVCQTFFECGLTDLLVWRLTSDLVNVLDLSTNIDNTRYWREAKYRAAGSLINLAEKCPPVAYQLGSDRRMILQLIETWGGAHAVSTDSKKLKGTPLLHLGLAAILHAAKDGALNGGLDDVMKNILEKETIRKKRAQRDEHDRKRQMNKIPSE